MAYPKLVRDIFENDGAGPRFREDKIPDSCARLSGAAFTGTVVAPTIRCTGELRTLDTLFASQRLFVQARIAVKGQKPSERQYTGVDICDKNGANERANRFGGLESSLGEDGDVMTVITAYPNDPAADWKAFLAVGVNASGSGYAYANTPFSATTFQSTSDRRRKEDLVEVTPDLSSLKTYRYTLKDDGQKHVGLIAQDVEKIIPEAVSENEEGIKSLDYNAVVAALVAEVNALKKRITVLEGENHE